MSELKYTIIKSEDQYKEYSQILKELVFSESQQDLEEEVELLTLLIEDWDRRHPLGPELDPVELVKAYAEEHGINQTELAEIAGVNRSYMSEMLNYKKRLSRNVVTRLAEYFNIQQEALNRTYPLRNDRNKAVHV
ncbi:MAG: helix-turn-helix domain-containing protein [Bacteroidota bacterium]